MPLVEILDGEKVFDRLYEDWSHLHRTSRTTSPFQSPIWIQTWTRHFSDAGRLRTIVVREGRDLVGLYPLVKCFGPWSPIRPAGVGPSDYLAPLVQDECDDVLDAIHDALVTMGKRSLIDLHQIPDDHPFYEHVEKTADVDQAKCLVLDLPESYTDYVASLSKSLRYDVRRLEGKALKEKGATVEWIEPATVGSFADQFFHLHRLRWKSRGLPGAFFGKGERFQRDWMEQAVQANMLSMNRLISSGEAVGCVYAMRSGTTCYFYQAGMDPAAASLSPGTILVAKMIEWAIAEGCDTFDFMRGDEPYKRRWKPNRERTNKRILIPPQNVVGRAGMWWNYAAWRVELKVRDRLEGKSLRASRTPSSNP